MIARVSMLLISRASLTCFRACFLAGTAKDLSAPRYCSVTWIGYLFIKQGFHDQNFQILPFSINYSAPKLKLDIGRILISTYWKSMTSFPFFACDFSASCISSLLLVPNIFSFFKYVRKKNQRKSFGKHIHV